VIKRLNFIEKDTMASSKYDRFLQWPVGKDVKTLADLYIAPYWIEAQDLDCPSPEGSLLESCLQGQAAGWVNHFEAHYYNLQDVETNKSHVVALVFSVNEQENQVFVFLKSVSSP